MSSSVYVHVCLCKINLRQHRGAWWKRRRMTRGRKQRHAMTKAQRKTLTQHVYISPSSCLTTGPRRSISRCPRAREQCGSPGSCFIELPAWRASSLRHRDDVQHEFLFAVERYHGPAPSRQQLLHAPLSLFASSSSFTSPLS
mmetsp:Transcript_3098/g.6338  ORF Transcript_3098/g.6338 Transcript_3098/m.6338 type:complete len:142 (-) Transcript_3098:356-781(-)